MACTAQAGEAASTRASAGARIIILNGEATPFDPIADVVVNAGISETLPQIVGGGATA